MVPPEGGGSHPPRAAQDRRLGDARPTARRDGVAWTVAGNGRERAEGRVDEPDHDRRLIGRLAAGDEAALEALYDRHAYVVRAVVLRVVGDRAVADELLQEAFLRVWQHAGAYDGAVGGVRPWLLGVAHNLALNELRRRRRRPQEEPADDEHGTGTPLTLLPDPGPEPDEAAWAAARRARLRQALAQLPETQRWVVALYAEGHSQSEIAVRLGQPLGTVKTRMRRGLLLLRDILRAEGFDVE